MSYVRCRSIVLIGPQNAEAEIRELAASKVAEPIAVRSTPGKHARILVFVDCRSFEEGQALLELNDTPLQGEKLVARPSVQTDDRRIFVRQLPFSMRAEELLEIGSRYGIVIDASICLDDQGRHRGFGIISFEGRDQAESAVEGINASGQKIMALPFVRTRVRTPPRSTTPDRPLVYRSDAPRTLSPAEARYSSGGLEHRLPFPDRPRRKGSRRHRSGRP
jgi:hypothetical protein